MEYRQLNQTLQQKQLASSAANEFRSLAQGIRGRIKGTITSKFIQVNKLPMVWQPSYQRFICMEQPQKEEKFQSSWQHQHLHSRDGDNQNIIEQSGFHPRGTILFCQRDKLLPTYAHGLP
jgi:hypothetical protein